MLTTPLPASMDCPSCAAVIDFDRRFMPWCAACDWNVDAGDTSEPKPSWFERRRQAVLSFRPRLRAGLYADRLAASVAGRDAVVSGLERIALHGAYVRAVSAVATAGRPATEVFAELDAQIAITPKSELERLRRREARNPFRFDQSHPPLAHRVAVLRQASALPMSPVPVSPERMRAIDAEFASSEARIARDLIEEHLASLS